MEKFSHIFITALVVSNIFFAYMFFTKKGSQAPTQSTQQSVQNIDSNSYETSKNYKKKFFSQAINEKGKLFQNCYNEYLEGKEKVEEGRVDFLFKLNLEGSIESLRVSKSEIDDTKFISCVQKIFEDIVFAPPPLGINLNFSYTLSFRDEKKFKKELEEKKKGPLELVPVKQDKKEN